MKNPKYSFVHITDLHLSDRPNCLNIEGNFSELPGPLGIWFWKNSSDFPKKTILAQTSYNELLLSTLANHINEHQPDKILVSGDLLTSSSVAETVYRKFFSASKTKPDDTTSFASFFSSQGNGNRTDRIFNIENMLILNGNHDVLDIETISFFGKRTTDIISLLTKKIDRNLFFRYFKTLENKKRLNAFSIHEELIIIFYDFSLDKERYKKIIKDKSIFDTEKIYFFLGSGYVDEEDINEIQSFLNKHNEKIIFVSHYPVFEAKEDETQFLSLYGERDKLQQLIKENTNVKLLLSGHTHKSSLSSIGQKLQIVCGTSSACNHEDKYFFVKLDIFDEKIIVTLFESKRDQPYAPYTFTNKEEYEILLAS